MSVIGGSQVRNVAMLIQRSEYCQRLAPQHQSHCLLQWTVAVDLLLGSFLFTHIFF